MRYTQIHGTTLAPSVLCLGTAPFGTDVDETTAFRLLDAFVARGGTFVDTARGYGEWGESGIGSSERVLGTWLKQRALRDRVVLATKGGQPLDTAPTVSRLDRASLLSDLEGSLRDLQVETVDLYWLHRDDVSLPVADILGTLTDQVQAGKIRYFGCSNWTLPRIREAAQYASAHALAGFVANQLMWSLADVNPAGIEDPTLVSMDASMWAYSVQAHLATVAYTPQARGYFTKLADRPNAIPAALRARYENAENVARLQRLQTVSTRMAISIPTLLLAYLTSQPVASFAICGNSTLQQLHENLQAGDVLLPADVLGYLETGQS